MAALVSLGLSACAGGGAEPSLTTGALSAGATKVSAAADVQPAARKPAERANERLAKVALLLPLSASGQTAVIAKSLKQAGEMALFDGGGSTLQLVVKDDQGTPQGAVAAAEEAVADGAELIIGPLFAASVKAVAPIAQRANVPVVAFSNDAHVAGKGVYLLSFQVTQDIDRIVGYAVSKGKKRFAAFVPDDGYGQMMGEAFRHAVASHGGVLKGMESFGPGGNAALEPARKLIDTMKRADEDGESVDAVFLPAGPEALPSLGPLLTYAGMDTARVKLIGTGAWDFAGIGREAAFIGGWFPAPEPRGWQEFSERFGKTFGSAPPRIATLSYDAVSFAMQLSANPPGGRFTPANLTRPNGFSGADGPFRLRGDGLADRGLAVLEVQKMGTNIVDPAPATIGPSQVSARAAHPVN